MRLEFSSARPPGPPPLSDGRWQRSYWPGGLVFATGMAVDVVGAGWLGQVVGLVGVCLLSSTFVARRHAAADAKREPRRWTITDEELRTVNGLGSVRWTWIQVRRVVEHPDAYLLYQSDSPHSAPFDVPRDGLTAAQEAEFRAFLAGRDLLAGR